MTLFEVQFFASPLAGIIGGVSATKGLPGANPLAAGAAGLLVGIAFFFAALFLTLFFMRLDQKRVPAFLAKAATVTGLASFGLMFLVPVASWYAAYGLVHAIYG